MASKNDYQRPPGREMSINDIVQSTFIAGDAQTPSSLMAISGEKIQIVNVMGVIFHLDKQGTVTNLLLDDGTENIIVRIFEERNNKFLVGDIVCVIGKVRLFNQEKYISPEIIKKKDAQWMRVRKIKLAKTKPAAPLIIKDVVINFNGDQITKVQPDIENTSVLPILEENILDGEPIFLEEREQLPMQKVTKLIKDLDRGGGALIEEILEKSALTDTEKIIQHMLEAGDIFQNAPGKVKML